MMEFTFSCSADGMVYIYTLVGISGRIRNFIRMFFYMKFSNGTEN